MIAKIREVLLTQYIGAIIVALLCWQAVTTALSAIVRGIYVQAQVRQSQSVFERTYTFNWADLILNLVTILLYLLCAYLLTMWLYPSQQSGHAMDVEDETESPSHD